MLLVGPPIVYAASILTALSVDPELADGPSVSW